VGHTAPPPPHIHAPPADWRPPAHPHRLFRPSGAGGAIEPGLLSADAIDALVAGGYTCVLWNAVPGDWTDAGWVERALAQIAAQEWTLLVLHDVAGAAAERLEEFLDRVDADFRQDFPPGCVPIKRGEITNSLEGLV
jgi:hypothetical protein